MPGIICPKGSFREGIVTPRTIGYTTENHSDWAAPIVVVPKGDGCLRVCGDYKVTVNPVLAVDKYPLPKPDDLMAQLAGGQKFSKLDLSQAYQQILLDENSRKFVTINTHLRLFQWTLYCKEYQTLCVTWMIY